MVNSRAKGCRYELELSKSLAALLGLEMERGARNGVPGADDVIGWPGVHIEAKRRKGIAALAWLKQSVKDCKGDVPIVVMREDRGEDVLMIRLEDLPRLCERVANATGRPVYPKGKP